ncbi:MAG: hypothetical protein AB2541_14425 [Candidatus Thiodiazotropha sp.]|nr:MAG: hypothetical protein DBP00_10685 [gamma proteobacterium symbiont of Ctena orbiculata]
MRKKTFALLIPGIFYLLLISSTSAVEGIAPGYNQWRPLAEREAAAAKPHFPAYQYRRSADRAYEAWPAAPRYGHPRSQALHSAKQPSWRPMSPATVASGPGYGIDRRYRFRPMRRAENRAAPSRWTYRPLQIDIPNHYVYRPLRVNRAANAATGQNPTLPKAADRVGYGSRAPDPSQYGHHNLAAPAQAMPTPYYPPGRHLSNYNSYRPIGPNTRHPGYYTDGWSNPVPQNSFAPRSRYAAGMPFDRYRFRPLNRSGVERYRYRGLQTPRYAANPYVFRPVYPQMPPGQANANNRNWMPHMGYPYPGMRQAMWRPVVPNRFGTNWYDGEADGDGAWYKLAGEPEWPRVSHYAPVE